MVEGSATAKRESPFNEIENRAHSYAEQLESLSNQIEGNISRIFGDSPPSGLQAMEQNTEEAPCNEFGRARYALNQVQVQIKFLGESIHKLLEQL